MKLTSIISLYHIYGTWIRIERREFFKEISCILRTWRFVSIGESESCVEINSIYDIVSLSVAIHHYCINLYPPSWFVRSVYLWWSVFIQFLLVSFLEFHWTILIFPEIGKMMFFYNSSNSARRNHISFSYEKDRESILSHTRILFLELYNLFFCFN